MMPHSEQPPDHSWHRFSTLAEAQEWIDLQSQAWNARLNDKERKAAVAYKGRQYKEINGWLRRTRQFTPGDEAQIKKLLWHLDAAIAKGSIAVDLVLYRGIYASAEDYQIGELMADNGYFSTTLSQKLAHRWATGPGGEPGLVFEVHTPAGTPAGFPDRLGIFEEQLEVLLERGTMLRVAAIQRPLTPSGHTVVVVDLVR
ncbi:MAG TPA: ADP-ribosyltransferase [Candidatus Xenobia bacterium]